MSSTKRVPVPPTSQKTNNNNSVSSATKGAVSSPPKKQQQATVVTSEATEGRGQPDYVRYAEAQGRALQRWEAQQVKWELAQQKLAEAVGKQQGASIAAAAHLYREKIEEMGKIEVAVPPAARSHASNSWEMSLRNGASATRYEPVGSSFPYPLYCPIHAPDQVRQDNPAFVHVIYPPDMKHGSGTKSASSKTVMESQYFKSRQQEFQGILAKKFSHFAEHEFFRVTGEPAPRTTENVDDDIPAGPVQFVPMVSKDGSASGDGSAGGGGGGGAGMHGGTHAITIRNLLAAQEKQQGGGDHKSDTSAGLQRESRTHQQQQQQQQQQSTAVAAAGAAAPSVGPMLVLSTNNLSFTTSGPNEVKQAIVTLENTGSTAIFYNWAPIPSAPALLVLGAIGGTEPHSSGSMGNNAAPTASPAPSAPSNVSNGAPPAPSTQLSSPFGLSNPVTGSILPGAHKMFCFSFRAAAPGVFVQHMELVTVPSGRERIVVTLRGVALAPEADAVSCDAIEQTLRAMVARSASSEIVRGDMIHNVVQNVFSVSDAETAVRAREAQIAAARSAHLVRRRERGSKWGAANIAVPLPFNEPAYAALELVRQRCNEFRGEFEAVLAPPRKTKAELAAIAAAEREAASSTRKKDHQSSAATPRGRKGDDEDAEPPPDRVVQLVGVVPADWDGSLRGLYEDINTVRTAAARQSATEAVSAIHRALAAAQEHIGSNNNNNNNNGNSTVADPFFESETAPLSNLVWLSAGRTWLGNALDKFERAAILAAARVEGRALCMSKGINMFGAPAKKGAAGGGGGGGGGAAAERGTVPAHSLGADLTAAAAATKPARGGGGGGATAAAAASTVGGAAASVSAGQQQQQHQHSGMKPTCGATAAEGEEETRALVHMSLQQLLLGAVEGMISTHDRDMEAIEAATVLPLSSLIVDSAERVVAARDMEAEPVLDLVGKKRK